VALNERAQKLGSDDNVSVVVLLLHGRGIVLPKSNSRLFARRPVEAASAALLGQLCMVRGCVVLKRQQQIVRGAQVVGYNKLVACPSAYSQALAQAEVAVALGLVLPVPQAALAATFALTARPRP
jgi:hypothetical protein